MKPRTRLLVSSLVASLALGGVLVGAPADAAFPGLNGKIAFTSLRTGNGEIFVMNPDGSAQQRLTDDPGFDSEPAWSRDGRFIAFNSDRDGNPEVYVMRADGSDVRRVTNHPAVDFHPAWTIDNRLLFNSTREGNFELYVMNADGTDVTRLTNSPATDWLPASSVRGDVAFTSNRDGDFEIYKLNLHRPGTVSQLTTNTAHDALPDWHPHGTALAFISERDYDVPPMPPGGPPVMGEIYVADANGRNQRRVTNTPGRAEIVPAWSPRGDKIAFTGCFNFTTPQRRCDIYVMNPDGSGEVQLTTQSGFQPDWQPSRSASIRRSS